MSKRRGGVFARTRTYCTRCKSATLHTCPYGPSAPRAPTVRCLRCGRFNPTSCETLADNRRARTPYRTSPTKDGCRHYTMRDNGWRPAILTRCENKAVKGFRLCRKHVLAEIREEEQLARAAVKAAKSKRREYVKKLFDAGVR